MRSTYIENAKLFIINLYSSYFVKLNNTETLISSPPVQDIQNECESFDANHNEIENDSHIETCATSQIVIQKHNNLSNPSYNSLNINNNRKRKKTGGILNFIKDSKPIQIASELTSIEIEIESYERHILVIDSNDQSDPHDLGAVYFFKKFNKTYPLLTNMAKSIFCIVATSVPSESLFSHTGMVQTDLRNRLSPDTLENIMFIKENLYI